MSAAAKSAFDAIRNARVEFQQTLLESTDPRCKTMQENARGEGMRDEGGGTKTEECPSASSLIPPPSSLGLSPLTARQFTAINLLTLGKSVVATAASIKVDPSTIHRWKSGNAMFIAELNRRQHDAYDSIIIQLRQTMLQAVGELHRLMSEGQKSEKREVMWKMLGFLRPQKLIEPTSPTEARDVIDGKIREGRARRGEIVEAPIEEEDRIAWVRAQEDDSVVSKPTDASARTRCHAERSEASRDDVQATAAKASAPSPRAKILREYALDDSAQTNPHPVERSDAFGPLEPSGANDRPLPQPLPQGEGSSSDERPMEGTPDPRSSEGDSHDAKEPSPARVNAYVAPGHPSCHAERSEASRDEVQATAAETSAPSPRNKILREYALDDRTRVDPQFVDVELTAPSSPAAGSLPERPCRRDPRG